MALRLPLCLFNRHAPHRHRVKWDGLNFVGTCRYCKSTIRKQARGGWRKDWLGEKTNTGTQTHPPHQQDVQTD